VLVELEVGLDRRRRGRVGRGSGEGRRILQELVDRRRFVFLFREGIALGERRHVIGVDAIDEAVEVFPEPRIGARSVRRFEQDADGAVEFFARLVEMAGVQFLFARLEVPLRGPDESLDGIDDRLGRRRRLRGGSDDRRRRRRRGYPRLRVGATRGDQRTEPDSEGLSHHPLALPWGNGECMTCAGGRAKALPCRVRKSAGRSG
jgi:hypothetical protein